MDAYGIVPTSIALVKSYLADRMYRMKVNGPAPSGDPHGSMIGSLLFVISNDDLPEVINIIALMYADDGKLIITTDE